MTLRARSFGRGSLALALAASPVACAGGPPGELGLAVSPVIYGADDRVEPEDYPDAEFAARVVDAAVALFSADDVDTADPNDVKLRGRSAMVELSLCPDERFADQIVPAFCSGTLISDRLVLTAGHCVESYAACQATRFVFGYQMQGGELATVTADDVYDCENLVVQRLDDEDSERTLDYAVVLLDRPVKGRKPAAVTRASGALAAGTPLVLAGFPSGLPLKIASDAEVTDPRAEARDYFSANTDSFAGNSGSSVYAADSGEVVGILVRGAEDYYDDGGCYRATVCASGGCEGDSSLESVTYAFQALDALGTCGNGTCDAGEDCCVDCGCDEGVECIANVCEVPPDCDALAVPIPAERGDHPGTLVGARSQLMGSCGGNGEGEALFRFTLDAAATLEARVLASDVLDPVLYVMADGSCPYADLACNDDREGDDLTAQLTVALDAGMYFLVVDSYDGADGDAFTLEVAFDEALPARGIADGTDRREGSAGDGCAVVTAPRGTGHGVAFAALAALWAAARRRRRAPPLTAAG